MFLVPYSGLSCGVYASNTEESCRWIAEESRCNIVLVNNEVNLNKFVRNRARLPRLRAIVQYNKDPKRLEGVYSVRGLYSDKYSDTLQKQQ